MGHIAEIARKMDEVPVLDRALASFLAEERIEGRPAYVAKLVLEEIARNLIQHAQDVTGDRIQLDVALQGQSLVLGLEDESAPFDPREAEEPDFDVPLSIRRSGGMGLHLVRAMTDEVRYEHVDGRNRLEVEIRLEAV